ncbi:transcription antitermination factor NusB [Pyruvatibacter sp.]|uniref:RsmB/NOP family class I SAM-dependent RNA methyltransferase n=1 Tax=Pyruvatibacter sp. TaxID=1981328 RepID=UPI0032EAC821
MSTHRPPKPRPPTSRPPRKASPGARAPKTPGMGARRASSALLHAVLHDNTSLDDALTAEQGMNGALSRLDPRDRGFARLIAATALRRHGQITDILGAFLDKPLPEKSGIAAAILHGALAELLFLDVAPHAAVSASVALAKADKNARHFAGLINAVLRRTTREGTALRDAQDATTLNTPDWLMQSWHDAYGADAAAAIAAAHLIEAPLDLSVRSDADGWAEKLGGEVLPTRSVRLTTGGRVDTLEGFGDGEWWVQDAAAALPARLFGDVSGQPVIDLCAAPGGKTLELAAAGAHVTAVDRSAQRLVRVTHNLKRMKLKADIITADATTWTPTADATPAKFILLDAPCSATGTIRRHPDIPHLKGPHDVTRMARLQQELLANAARIATSGTILIYCTCSLQPEEGEQQVAAFLATNPDFARVPITPNELPGLEQAITPDGDMRTLPTFWAEKGGMDGFFAARLKRR